MHPPMRHELQHDHLLFENVSDSAKISIDSANLGVKVVKSPENS